MSQVPFINPYGFMPPFQQRNNNGQTDSFLAYMQDGKVYRQTPEGPQQIGVASKTYDDLQSEYDNLYKTTKEYYDELVARGVITPEPTQEELLKRQSEQLKEQAEQLANASRVIAESAKNQKALENMLISLQSEIASLKNPCPVNELEGGENEYFANSNEQPAVIASLEGQDEAGMANNARLSELPKRSDAGNVRTQGKHPAASKKPGLPPKRPGGRDS